VRRGALNHRFCPRCGAPGVDDATLCSDCGESLAPQGYCEVCEAYWTLAPDTACPKHELALVLPARKPSREAAPRPREPWVTVARYGDALRAEAPRIRLEAEGIPTFLEGERMGSPSMYHVATGGVKLHVPASLAADARILLEQSWSIPHDDEDDDRDEAWDDFEPDRDPDAARRDAFRYLVLLVLLTPLLLVVLALWLRAR
jgi:hypothetical protein